MAFGRTQQAKDAESNNQGIAQTAVDRSGDQNARGIGLMNSGGQAVQSGTNFFNTVLNGNREAGTAALAPDINRIREGNQNALQTSSTLMPRGGGRAASLFGRTFATNDAVNSLYGGVRSGAAGNLAAIGQGQQSLGANLFGIANSGLNTGMQANANVLNYEQAQQQAMNSLWSSIGQGAAGLVTGLPSFFGHGQGQAGAYGGVQGGAGIPWSPPPLPSLPPLPYNAPPPPFVGPRP